MNHTGSALYGAQELDFNFNPSDFLKDQKNQV